MEKNEIWRQVVGFESLYEVSSLARIRRVGGNVLKQQPLKGGYRIAFLWKEGKQTTRLVHIIVASAFLGPCPPGKEVNHKRGSEEGDLPDNLEYLTHQENCKHAYATGLRVPSVAAAQAARRQTRVTVACECGCATAIQTPDTKGRKRRFALGHGGGVRYGK